MTQVFQTTDYGMFKRIKGNRPINKAYLAKLTNSILKRNLLEQNPVIINEKNELVDGQHRLEICRNNKLPVYYIIKEGASLTDVQQLNSAVRAWSSNDYLQSYITQGYADYKKLKDFSDANEISLTNAMLILTDRLAKRDTEGIREDFRSGNFKITEPKYAQEFMEKLADIKSYLEEGVCNDREFLYALARLLLSENLDWQKLLDKFEESKYIISRQVGVRDYLKEFEDVINYKIKTNRTRYF